MRTAAILAAALILLAPLVQPAPAPKPSLKVDLWPGEQAVNYSSYVQDIVFFGRISLDDVPYAKYEVFLRSHDNPNWATSCTPDHVVFWGAGSAVFNLTVRVPMSAANQTAKIWVESRATYEDTDVAGNYSAPVFVTVGPLPANTNITQNGDRFFGGVSKGTGTTTILLASVAMFIFVGIIMGAAVWRWKRRRKQRIEQVNK